MADRVAEEADRLYGLPLDEFTTERDAAAKALRREGEKDAAKEVGALPKPSAGAWAVNAIAREQPELRDELLAAGDELREAQDAALAGEGPAALREATARQRRAIDAILDAAGELRPGGRPLSAAALHKLRSTLQAAAGDDDVRSAIAAGRLVRDAEGGGAWPFAAGEAAPKHAARPGAKAKTSRRADTKDAAREGKTSRRGEKEDAAAREAAERERREAEERRKALESQLAEARAERRARERELARAERDAERAERRLDEAQAALDEAKQHAEEARDELGAARKAVDRARDDAARLEEQLD